MIFEELRILKHELLGFKEVHLEYVVPTIHHLIEDWTTTCPARSLGCRNCPCK
jgi:hypothetical protein